jgi:hypothetical protein
VDGSEETDSEIVSHFWYLTELPPRKLLEKKLYDSLRLAREPLTRNDNHRRNIEHAETPDMR